MIVVPPLEPARILVLVSGAGSNMQELVKAAADPSWGGSVVALGADRECLALEWAKERGIPCFVEPLVHQAERVRWDQALAADMRQYEPDLVVCAGFMKLLGPAVLEAFPGRILNTHNALLPSFPGVHGPRDAVQAGVKLSGATLFFVDPGVDTGQIVAQTAVPVLFDDTADSLLERIKVAERTQLVESVGRLIREGWKIDGRRVDFGSGVL